MTERYHDISGKMFGSLRAIEIDRDRTLRGRTYWWLQCECGKVISASHDKLFSKKTPKTSCGCKTKCETRFQTKHDMSHKPEYKAWRRMKGDCLNPTNKGYFRYGGRGIKVHDEWISSFEAFFKYVGEKPTPRHSLDRIDVNGNYEPGNVRWATHSEQMRNTRKTVYAVINGERRPLSDWCDILGHKRSKIWSRVSRGMTPEEALLS